MPRRQAENTEKKNQKERRVMSQKERVDLIEVDLLDMCKYRKERQSIAQE